MDEIDIDPATVSDDPSDGVLDADVVPVPEPVAVPDATDDPRPMQAENDPEIEGDATEENQ